MMKKDTSYSSKGNSTKRKISILSIYAPNARAPTFIKEPLLKLKTHIESHTKIVVDFNTPLLPVDMLFNQKLNREKLREIMNQVDLTNIYRAFYPKTKEYTFFSTSHGIFSKIFHIIHHKTNLNLYKKIKIIPCIISNHHGLRVVFNNNKMKESPHVETEKLSTQ
jgi:ssDNA-specific exonuclease RecJ